MLQINNLIAKSFQHNTAGTKGGSNTWINQSAPLSDLMRLVTTFRDNLATKVGVYDSFNGGFSNVTEMYEAFDDDVQTQGASGRTPVEVDESAASQIYNGVVGAIEQSGVAADSGVLNIVSGAGLQYTMQCSPSVAKSGDTGHLIDFVTASGKIPMLYRVGEKYYFDPIFKARQWFDSEIIHPDFSPTVTSAVQLIFEAYAVPNRTISVGNTLIELLCYTYCSLISDFSSYVTLISTSTISGVVNDILNFFPAPVTNELVYDLLNFVRDHHLDQPVIRKAVACEQAMSVLYSTIQSTEINALLIEIVDKLKTSTFGQYISSLASTISEFKDGCKTVIKNVLNAWNQGGFKGVVYFFIDWMRGQSSLINEDGLFRYTDNRSIIPVQYVAGLVGSLVGSALSILGFVVNATLPILGAVFAVAGTVLTGIFNSFKYDESVTRPGFITDNTNQVESITSIPVVPTGFLKGEVTATPWLMQWARDLYDQGSTMITLDVPGGKIFMGPGSFDQWNHKLKTFKWEFHPYSICIKQEAFTNFYTSQRFRWYNSTLLLMSTYGMIGASRNYIEEWWTNVYSDPSAFDHSIVNQSDGALSEESDWRLYGSVCLCTLTFILWILSLDHNEFLGFTSSPYEIYCDTTHADLADYMYTCILNGYKYLYGENNPVPAWSTFTMMAERSQEYGVTLKFVNSDHVSIDGPLVSVYGSEVGVNAEGIIQRRFYGTPLGYNEFSYNIKLPQYDRTTFWVNIVATVATTAIVAVGTIIATVKWTKFKKRKRAENVARFNDAQSTYQSALKGTKTVIGEDGEPVEVTFDVDSPEGKAYIDSCYKDYRKTARVNNRWQKLIGGTRYDTTTFYGEADSSDESESGESDSTILDRVNQAKSDAGNYDDGRLISVSSDQNVISPYENSLFALLCGEKYIADNASAL